MHDCEFCIYVKIHLYLNAFNIHWLLTYYICMIMRFELFIYFVITFLYNQHNPVTNIFAYLHICKCSSVF